MSQATYRVGRVLDRLREIPDGTVDLVVTSFPYLALRSYLPPDHPDKADEIGAEATPAEYLDKLLAVTAEMGRVLAPHGSICCELGDTFAGSGGAGGDYGENGWREGQARFDGTASKAFGTGAAPRPARTHWRTPEESRQGVDARNRGNTSTGTAGKARAAREAPGPNGRASMVDDAEGGHHLGGSGWPLDKSLCGIPALFQIALAYGLNPLTGQDSPAGLWRCRNSVVHGRPNPPVGALGDKWRTACSYWTVATKARRRWFDLDAVRTPSPYAGQKASTIAGTRTEQNGDTPKQDHDERVRYVAPATAPPLDWFREDEDQFSEDLWVLPTFGYPGAHYATFSPKLVIRFIESMCPQRVCTVCGTPSERIVARESMGVTSSAGHTSGGLARLDNAVRETLGWSDCGHGAWRPGLVLDPFAGSGTVGEVATGCGRDALLLDFDARNVDLALQRIGMFLAVEFAGPDEPATVVTGDCL